MFHSLDAMQVNSSFRRRPSGDPAEDARSHLVQAKLREKERLGHLLEQVEQENRRLHQALLPRKQHLLDTKHKINERLKEFDKVGDTKKGADTAPADPRM